MFGTDFPHRFPHVENAVHIRLSPPPPKPYTVGMDFIGNATLKPAGGGSSNFSPQNTTTQIQDAYSEASRYLFGIVAAVIFIYILVGGIKYVTAGSDTKKAAEARQALLGAVIAAMILMGIYTIVSIAISLGKYAAAARTAEQKL